MPYRSRIRPTIEVRSVTKRDSGHQPVPDELACLTFLMVSCRLGKDRHSWHLSLNGFSTCTDIGLHVSVSVVSTIRFVYFAELHTNMTGQQCDGVAG